MDRIFDLTKKRCPACNGIGLKMSKEHVFPKWLISRTGTNRTGIKWINGSRIPALAATIPLCEQCNQEFGRELEAPVSRIFAQLESGQGVSDNNAELLIRWLWKLEGFAWIHQHPDKLYTIYHTLNQRVLRPIYLIRGHLTLAIGLIDQIDPTHGDLPMGVDSVNKHNAVFVAGVFLKVAIMVLLNDLAEYVPSHFSIYRLNEKPDELSDAKLFYPKVGFKDDNQAVRLTTRASFLLSRLHDDIWRVMKQMEKQQSG